MMVKSHDMHSYGDIIVYYWSHDNVQNHMIIIKFFVLISLVAIIVGVLECLDNRTLHDNHKLINA